MWRMDAPRRVLPPQAAPREAAAIPARRAAHRLAPTRGAAQAGGRAVPVFRVRPRRHAERGADRAAGGGGRGAARHPVIPRGLRSSSPIAGGTGGRIAGRRESEPRPNRSRLAAGEAAIPAGIPPARPPNRPPSKRGAPPKPRLSLTLSYIMRNSGYAAKGQVVHPGGFESYMRGRVGPRHLDLSGAEIIRSMFGRVGMSGFKRSTVDDLLSTSSSEADPWQVGEPFAECYLEDYEGALFPYLYSRDVKSERASHAGADLVGYSLGGPDGESAMFLFGEVKTSGEERRPPRAAGKLADQLTSLCLPGAQRALVRRLSFKAAERKDPKLLKLHRESASSYSAGKFRLAGVLIRDLEADRSDIDAAFAKVSKSRCAERLDMISLYLPVQLDRLGGMLE